MKKFSFDFNLSAWVSSLEIEAEDYDSALEQLKAMSLEDIVDQGYVKDSEITDLECYEDEEDLD